MSTTHVVWSNARVVTCDPSPESAYGLLPGRWAITVKDGRIDGLLPMTEYTVPHHGAHRDLAGMLVTPGLIDCHTHLVFAGDRAAEWEARFQGATYESLAQVGGGILSTVKATRGCDEEALLALALPRLKAMVREGVTCVEIKSGYGLTVPDEIKLLKVIRRLTELRIAEISPTLLAAHAIPPEYHDAPDRYVDLICDTLIPHVSHEGLADAVDVFCEHIAFSLTQCDRIFACATHHGLPIKAHAEQLSPTGCAKRVAAYNGWSVDHIEYLTPQDAQALRAGSTVAVLLPGAFYAMREKHLPPIEALRSAGVPMAVATDCNPGTSPFTSLRLMMHMACVLFSLTPAEALIGVTRSAARALGRGQRIGTIAVGKDATLCAWDTNDPASIVCDLTRSPLAYVMVKGEERHV